MTVRKIGLCLLMLLHGIARAEAQKESLGITRPFRLSAFDPTVQRCAAPTGLSKTLAFAQDNEREFMRGVARGLRSAAADRGLSFEVAQAANDPARMIAQVDGLVGRGVGAIVAAPVDAIAIAPHLRRAIWAGVYVGTVVPPPAITILNAPQYLTGKVLGDEAAAYIRTRLNGKAKVVLLTHDSLQFLAPRFTAMRDALKSVPEAEIVADISPPTVDEAGGAEMMRTILLANPDVDVVLGADTVVLGALATLRQSGKARATQFLGGIDGEPAAVAEIKKGGPYKASVSLASTIFGYALGQFAADWLDGRSVPQAMDVLPKALTKDNIAQYEADVADPGAVFKNERHRSEYLTMYGNICYESRDRFLDFPWSSERK